MAKGLKLSCPTECVLMLGPLISNRITSRRDEVSIRLGLFASTVHSVIAYLLIVEPGVVDSPTPEYVFAAVELGSVSEMV